MPSFCCFSIVSDTPHRNNDMDQREPNRSAFLVASKREQPIEVKIDDIVANGVSGMLHKWVNYGKGWRPRWFVLQDGVLSYYKIHGPDKIIVNKNTLRGKIIGQKSLPRMSRKNNDNSENKPFGEVHLKVSSIRECKSDEKRFSIFTGTKRLHLRTDTREDSVAWIEALKTVKDMFPRMSNAELMASVDNYVVSTEKLRQLLHEEGMGEEAIQGSEQIMQKEFMAMQKQLMSLQQKHSLLMDTLRQLEVQMMIHRKQKANKIQSFPTVIQPKFSIFKCF